MKKTFVILFVGLMTMLVTGCGKETANGIENVDADNSNKMEYYTKISNFNCPDLNSKAKEVNRNYFVGQDGFLYEYSFNKLFSSTNTNCSKVDTNGKYMEGFSGGFVYDDNDYEYYLDDISYDKTLFITEKKYEHEKSREYFIKKSFPNSNLQLFLISAFGIIVEDNKLYEVKYTLGGGSTDKKEINFDNSDEIVNIYEMHHSSEAFYVETNHSYFTCEKEITNNQECETYADIECKKEFVCKKISDFENLKVKKFLGDIVILDNGDIYKTLNLSTAY